MLYLDSNHNLQHSKAPDLIVNVFNSRYTTSEESVTLQPHVENARYEVIRDLQYRYSVKSYAATPGDLTRQFR